MDPTMEERPTIRPGAIRWRSRSYARDATQMAEPRSSVKYDNVFPDKEGWG